MRTPRMCIKLNIWLFLMYESPSINCQERQKAYDSGYFRDVNRMWDFALGIQDF